MLLDNNIPVKLANWIVGHEILHVRDLGWGSLLNGELVAAASDRFEFLITGDRNMQFQTSLKGSPICVLVLKAKSNHIDQLLLCVAPLLRLLETPRPGEYVEIAPEPNE